jgi:glutamate formiminotransferase/glutamate formiminotransferase/formiminotetrahydrofolate cyclodeaminase
LSATTLLAVPNVSEGCDREVIQGISLVFQEEPAVRLLDVHTDPDHHRSVFTLAGSPGSLSGAVLRGAREAVARIDLTQHQGAHPRVGAIDIAPIVHLRDEDLGAACAEALVLADLLGQEGLPVFLYGLLGGGRTRAELRRGGLPALTERMAAGELRADFGPGRPHPTAGAVLVGARPPLIAFNVELAPPARVEEARSIAALIREGGAEGLPGLRAIGVWLGQRGVAQVSMNVEDHRAAPLPRVVGAIERHAQVAQAELVGLAPRAALEGFPEHVPLSGGATIEDALARAPSQEAEND